MGPVCLGVVAGLGPATTAAASAEVPLERLPLVLAGAMAEDAALREELQLRLPDHAILVPTSPAEIPIAFLWIGVARPEEGAFVLQVIVSDGRLYERRIQLPSSVDRARVTAGAIANLVDGIERSRVAPTRTQVEVPPLVEQEEDAEPAVVVSTPPAPPMLESSETVPEEAEALRPIVGHLHVLARGSVSLGLGPPGSVTGPIGAGGELGAAWVRRHGLLLGGAVRGLGWRAQGLGIGRVRLAAQAGYVHTWSAWSLSVAGGPTLEPLWLTASVREPGGDARPGVPLVGFAASVGPRWRAWSSRQGPSLWLGVDLEVAGSAETRRAPGVVLVRDARTSEALVRAGGAELSAGVVLALRVPRRR